MSSKRLALLGVGLAALAVPALALAGGGVPPREGVQYAKTGTSNFVFTDTDGDANSVAETADVSSIGIYKCGNNTPVGPIDDLAINDAGRYKFDGKADTYGGQRVNVLVKGVFKDDDKGERLIQRTTISKRQCERTVKVKMKPVE